MVELYEYHMIHSLAAVAPLRYSLNNGQELPIKCVIVLIGTCAFPRLEVY